MPAVFEELSVCVLFSTSSAWLCSLLVRVRAAPVCSPNEQRKNKVRPNRTEHVVAVDCWMSELKSITAFGRLELEVGARML